MKTNSENFRAAKQAVIEKINGLGDSVEMFDLSKGDIEVNVVDAKISLVGKINSQTEYIPAHHPEQNVIRGIDLNDAEWAILFELGMVS